MKALGALLVFLGGMGMFIGKYGALVSLIAWIVGLLGLITYVSFWWVTGMVVLALGSVVTFAIGGALVTS